jgi:predicted CoA-binding protein
MNPREILKRYRRVAVVGISANPDRPSHWIARYLIEQGFEVTGVNPGLPKIAGIPLVASVNQLNAPLEIVNVYRSPDAIPALIEELAPLHPPVLWLQPGAQNPQAEKHARDLGMVVISGPCIYVEHRESCNPKTR